MAVAGYALPIETAENQRRYALYVKTEELDSSDMTIHTFQKDLPTYEIAKDTLLKSVDKDIKNYWFDKIYPSVCLISGNALIGLADVFLLKSLPSILVSDLIVVPMINYPYRKSFVSQYREASIRQKKSKTLKESLLKDNVKIEVILDKHLMKIADEVYDSENHSLDDVRNPHILGGVSELYEKISRKRSKFSSKTNSTYGNLSFNPDAEDGGYLFGTFLA
jgi:hypothetical protein